VRSAAPTSELEDGLRDAGDRIVVGIDEVGRGAWAGPVTVAAVVAGEGPLAGVRDSKLLAPAARQRAAAAVREWSPAIAVGHAGPEECDALGMTAALRLAAERALAELESVGFAADRVILDGSHDYLGRPGLVRTVVKGDRTVLTVAAASVVAKTLRDGLMVEAADHYPAYGFDRNRGYPAPVHRIALAGYGPSAIHRRSWGFMDQVPWPGVPRFERELRLL